MTSKTRKFSNKDHSFVSDKKFGTIEFAGAGPADASSDIASAGRDMVNAVRNHLSEFTFPQKKRQVKK